MDTKDIEKVMHSILDRALEMVFLTDTAGRILYANAAARKNLGFGDELIGEDVGVVFTELRRNEDGSEDLSQYVSESENATQDLHAYRKNKTFFTARTHVEITHTLTEGYAILFLDVSDETFLKREVKNAGAEVEEAGKVKTEFVANVTHELRTPVNGILGNARELIKVESNEDKLRKLNLIERSCDNMNAIINSILDFSKLSAGKFLLEAREFSFKEMMNDIKENHKVKINEKGLDFFVTVSPKVPDVLIGDELRLVQILNNLLSNATKFTSIGRISLEVVLTGRVGKKIELFFLVIDTGIGIAKEDTNKLFKSFSQVDASISRTYGGTGLGLNITKQLVELMGGSISVESEAGKGSTFSFSVWLEDPNATGKEESVTMVSEDFIKNLVFEEKKDDMMIFGTPQNKEEILKRLSKLALCLEMGNWEKAEMFAETTKQLMEEAPQEFKSKILRMKMAVQKENYEKSVSSRQELEDAVLSLP